MSKRIILSLFLGLISSGILFTARTQAQTRRPISEIDKIYAEDQLVRQSPRPDAPKRQYHSDAERENATRKLLARGKLQSARDFEEAAVIFQHSRTPGDYLLAHTLALIAVSKGDTNAVWIAAATLDRYLMSSGKPQIYGTQFLTPPGGRATQEPYNRTLISDTLRKQLGVPSLKEQEQQLKKFQQQ